MHNGLHLPSHTTRRCTPHFQTSEEQHGQSRTPTICSTCEPPKASTLLDEFQSTTHLCVRIDRT